MLKKVKAATQSIKTGVAETKARKAQHDKWEAAGRPGLENKDKK